MKKNYVLSLLIAALFSLSAFAQTSTLNLDFESWDNTTYPNPTSWDSPNATIAGIFSTDWVLMQETGSVVSGTSALKLESKTITIPIFGNVDIPGFATLGTLDVNTTTQTYSINGGEPFTDRPDKLLGSFLYNPVGTDQCVVEVVLLNYNEVTSTIIDTIGYGSFIGNTTTAWENFEVIINYTSTATPNYVNINLVASYPEPVDGSTLWVDDLSFYTAPVSTGDLFFSEYVEGSSNNKGLEIYNPSSSPIALDNYQIAQSSNGNGWAYYHTFPAGASIASGDVWVIITDQMNPALFPAADADEVLSFPSVVHHNGDDARALIKIQGSDTIFIDIIGEPNVDPGSGWDVAGVASGTANHTLIRKPSIMQGNTDWAASAGTDAINSEWIVEATDYINLGTHTTGASMPQVAITSPVDGETIFSTDLTVEFSVSNFSVGAVGSGADGHLHYVLNTGTPVMQYDLNPIEFTALPYGTHTFILWLVDDNHQELVPPVGDTITFTLAESNLAEIVSFSVPGQVGSAIIDNAQSTVTAYVAAGTALTSLVPTIEVSDFASINPASGVAQDFTSAVSYTVTAQDGTIRTWEVSVAEQPEGTLFFSEYVEGSSNNKGLEIYNPTAGPISLDDYQIAQTSNGSGWTYFHTFPAGASIAAGDVWVIITDQMNPALFSAADADEVLSFPSVVHYNGDDARALIKIEGTDTTIVDQIGVPDIDPGDGWDVAGVTEGTLNHTLIRKPEIIVGNDDWAASAGTDAANSEWIVEATDYINLGTHYTGGNLAPTITNVTFLPAAITDADTVIVAATITDADGTVSSVSFAWGLDGINFPNSLTLTNLFDVYTTLPNAIPAQAQGTTVYFQYIATDDLGAESIYIGQYTVISDPVEASIYEIQGQAAASPLNGQIVTTSGIVTGLLPGSSQGYFIQDGDGAWNGIFVYDNVNLPAVGDEIEVTALVHEYYDLTELKEVSAFVVLSSGNTLPNPSILTTADVNQEDYEGVFVRVENATCTNEDYGFGMWEVNDGSGATLVHNNDSYTYAPIPGTAYNVQGVLNYNFEEWKIELRMEGDVTPYVSVNEILSGSSKLYPNPVRNRLYLEIDGSYESLQIFNLLGEQVYSLSDLTREKIEIETSDLINGIYFIQLHKSGANAETLRFIKQ